jgi:hypothetical protein
MSFNIAHRAHRAQRAKGAQRAQGAQRLHRSGLAAQRSPVSCCSLAIAVLTATAACGTPAPGSTDSRTPDAREGGGGPPGVRLNCTLGSVAALPVTLGNVTLNKVRLSVRSIQVIGDAGGDARTKKQDLSLLWQSRQAPTRQEFVNFPPGLYSGVTTKIDADVDEAYEFTGVATVGGRIMPFELYDSESYSQTMPAVLAYSVGDSVDLELKANIAGVINAINFANLDDFGGVLGFGVSSEIDKASAAMKQLFSLTVK